MVYSVFHFFAHFHGCRHGVLFNEATRGSEETEETAFPGASEKVEEKPAMITAPCPQPSDHQVTEARADELFRLEDGDNYEGGTAGIAGY